MMTLDKFYSEFKDSEVSWFKSYRLYWQSDDQWLCHLFLQRLFSGFHHIPRDPKPHGSGIELNFRPVYFSTFDNDQLTKAVIMAHNWGVRLQINGSGPGMIKLCLWKRKSRDGEIYSRHPVIQTAVERYKDF